MQSNILNTIIQQSKKTSKLQKIHMSNQVLDINEEYKKMKKVVDRGQQYALSNSKPISTTNVKMDIKRFNGTRYSL